MKYLTDFYEELRLEVQKYEAEYQSFKEDKHGVSRELLSTIQNEVH